MGNTLATDQRALAGGLFGFFAILAVVALLYTLMDSAALDIFSSASAQTSNSEAQAVIDERTQIWNLIPYFGLFLASVFLIGRAVVESRRPG